MAKSLTFKNITKRNNGIGVGGQPQNLKNKRKKGNNKMWVIEIATGKKKYIRCAEVVEDWLRDEPKCKMIKK